MSRDIARMHTVDRKAVAITIAATIVVIGITIGGIAVSLAAYAMLLY